MSHHSHGGAGNRVIEAIKNNPEALLLMAAGGALLMRARRPSADEEDGDRIGYYGDAGRRWAGESQRFTGSSGGGMNETFAPAGEEPSDSGPGMGERVRETAGRYASSISTRAEEARRSISDQSEYLAREARSRLEHTGSRVLQDYPWAVAIGGLAAGAAVAALFPATGIEKRTLGVAGDELADAAARAGEQLRSAASEAGDRLKNAAEERGLNSEGLEEVARDVAGAFGEAAGERSGDGTGGAQGEQPGSAEGSGQAKQPSTAKRGSNE